MALAAEIEAIWIFLGFFRKLFDEAERNFSQPFFGRETFLTARAKVAKIEKRG